MIVDGLDHQEQDTLDRLLDVYWQKMRRNLIRSAYYDAKYALKDLGIAIPPDLSNLDMVLGWPAKAVDVLARRCNLDGFVIPGSTPEDWGVDEVWINNRMDIETPQATTSALLHAVCFLTTTLGDVQAGEPRVLMTARSAMSGAGIWDSRRRMLSSALSIVERSDLGIPTSLVMYLPASIVMIEKMSQGWQVDRRPHKLGRVPVEPLVYQPRLEFRPLGSSRLSRPVMSLADAALRTTVRTEVMAEFFSAPQRWIMGADESAFTDENGKPKGQWESIIGRIWGVPGGDVDEKLPQVGQFPQVSMQPNFGHLEQIAKQFAGETSVPVSSLGIIQDNPASAEAIHAAKEDLIIESRYAMSTLGAGYARGMVNAIQLQNGLDETPAELLKLRARWRNPETPSQAAMADAMTKQISALPWLADTTVALEQFGYDQATIERLNAERQQRDGLGIIDRLTAAADKVNSDAESGSTP